MIIKQQYSATIILGYLQWECISESLSICTTKLQVGGRLTWAGIAPAEAINRTLSHHTIPIPAILLQPIPRSAFN